MASTFTPNIDLEEPARGDQVGVWDTPVNSNMTVIDLIAGGRAVISGAAGSVVLAAAQFQANTITFNSTLLASITVTFPTSFKKPYQIQNACTGSSAFTITLLTTTAGATAVCAPPGQIVTVSSPDGFNMNYVDLPFVGSYWDYAGSSVPNWVSGCTIPPYLACTGGTFSATLYPTLAVILGSTTLPDARGRARFALDGGAGRLTVGNAGFNPNIVATGGGDERTGSHTHVATDSGHTHTGTVAIQGVSIANLSLARQGGNDGTGFNEALTINAGFANITVSPQSSGGLASNIPPAYIGGITMIRAG